MGKGVKGEVRGGGGEIGIIFFKFFFLLNVHIQIFNIKFKTKRHIKKTSSPPLPPPLTLDSGAGGWRELIELSFGALRGRRCKYI